MNLKKVLKLMVPCAMLSFAHLVSNATTVIVTPGSTLPSVINSGDIYICQGTSTFYGNSVSIMPTAKLVIKDGATLKMTGRIVVNNGSASWPVGGGSPPIVEGGVLEINNATITSQNAAANGRWLGIEVWGQGGMYSLGTSPYYEARGKVIINGGTITKATCGIINTSRIVSTSPFYSYPKKGGIVQADNALFLNNDTMIYHVGKPFWFAPKKKLSIHINGPEHFVNCTFKLDANYTHSTPSGAVLHPWMVRLVDANGLQFLACKFINNKYYGPTFANRNVLGIYALNSSFKVSNKYKVTGFTPWGGSLSGTTTGESKFDNFYDGILAINGTGTKPVWIDNTSFINVTRGIEGDNLSAAIIEKDTFTLTQIGSNPLSGNTPTGDRTCAIALSNSSAFKVRHNIINGIDGNKLSFGIVIAGAGSALNIVNKNILKNTKYALRGEYDNDNYSSLDTGINNYGLKFLCNQMEVNNNHASSFDISAINNGMSSLQGFKGSSSYYSATNTFDILKSTGGYHVYNSPDDNPRIYVGYTFSSYYMPNSDNTENMILINSDNPLPFSMVYYSCEGPTNNVPTLSSGIKDRIQATSLTIQDLQDKPNKTTTEQGALNQAVLDYFAMMDSVISYYYYNIDDVIDAPGIRPILKVATGHYYHQLLLADLEVAVNDFEAAVQVLQNVLSNFNLSQSEQSMINQMINMVEITDKYYNVVDGDWTALSSSEKAMVENYKDNAIGHARSMARSIWYAHHDYSLQNNTENAWAVIEPTAQQRPTLQQQAEQQEISIFPNPAHTSVSIDLGTSFDAIKLYTYQICDINGAVLAKGYLSQRLNNINTQYLPQGLYLIQINCNFERVSTQKLSILK